MKRLKEMPSTRTTTLVTVTTTFGILLLTLLASGNHSKACHERVANGIWEPIVEGKTYSHVLSASGGKVKHQEELTQTDECSTTWKTMYASAPSAQEGRRRSLLIFDLGLVIKGVENAEVSVQFELETNLEETTPEETTPEVLTYNYGKS